MSKPIEDSREFTSIEGRLVASPSVRIFTSKESVYTHCILGAGLTADDPCEVLVETLISLCLSGPGYIVPHECRRHAAFLHDFMNSKVPDYCGWSGQLVEVKSLPIKCVFKSLEFWVYSLFSPDRSPLLPHFALHTADLVGKLVTGTYEYNQSSPFHWRIEPLLKQSIPSSDFLGRSFKKRFSENIYCRVLAEVPEGVKLTWYRRELGSGERFEFGVGRCHLSETVDSGLYPAVVEPAIQSPDCQLRELWLKGHILNGSGEGWRLDLPTSWITHEIVDRDEEAEAVPVKQW